MERKWTRAQSKAIDTRERTLLVSAAAGSGKTAALTERIIRSITDTESPADISKMLIVTFTRAAASELRQKISEAIARAWAKDPQNRYLGEQFINVSNAKICTIDSFYLDVVRSNFDRLSISPSFRTADSAELDVLAREIMEDTIDFFYATRREEFSFVSQCFVGLRNSSKLGEILLDLYSTIESYPEGVDFLKTSAERTQNEAQNDFFSTSYGVVIKESLAQNLEYILDCYRQMCQSIISDPDSALTEAYLPSFSYDKTFLEKLLDLMATESYGKCRAYATSYSPISLRSIGKHKSELSEKLKNERTAFVKKIRSQVSRGFSLTDASICVSMKKTSAVTMVLYDLMREFEQRYNAHKKQRNIASFSDVRRYALELLVCPDGEPTELARQYSEQFTHIYIDEYQDVDRVQDMIFCAISTPTNRFMVGDIKQSIYRFRGAEPDVFAAYRKRFPEAFSSPDAEQSSAISVFMSNNFRCDKSIIDFTNAVCSFFFSECAESIGYTKEDDLVFSKIDENRVTAPMPVEVRVIVPPEDEDKESDGEDENYKEIEAEYIADRISALLRGGKKADGSRIRPEDIAVLFRSRGMGEYVRRALNERGIPCTDNTSAEYFENPDVLLVLCLLNAIDNPHRDIYLAGLLRSPLYEFTMDELIEIRQSGEAFCSMYDALLGYALRDCELGRKCRAFSDELDGLRQMARSLTVDKLIRRLYACDLFVRTGLVGNDNSNNLLRLYEYARRFESSSFKGLYNFIVYINRIIEQGTKLENLSGQIEAGKVTLMTIHQSKGLEFPVCFLCNTAGKFNTQDIRESMLCHARLGVAMKISDPTGLARINTPMREALIRMCETEMTEEEMRVLYVALTRARERLIITAATKRSAHKLISEAEARHEHKSRFAVFSAHSYLEWILAALNSNSEDGFYTLEFISPSESNKHFDTAYAELTESTEATLDEEQIRKATEILNRKFSFVYPHEQATKLPAKISVSRLLPESENMKNEDQARLFDDMPEYSPPRIFKDRSKASPTAAERGTATHLFLQFCDLEGCEKDGVLNELERLIERKFIPNSSRELIFIDEIEKFFESDMYTRIKNARRIVREQRFNILLPTSTLNDDPEFIMQTEGEMLAVQGVIDVLWEDEDKNIFLCDYKTDRLLPNELSNAARLKEKMTERHGKQLKYYAEAVERLFSKECKGVFIYSTHAATAVEIDLQNV